jgi:hypothetical protein
MPYRRDDYFRAIQTKIGEALHKQQTVSEPLPQRLAQLLDELDERLSEWLRERDAHGGRGSGTHRTAAAGTNHKTPWNASGTVGAAALVHSEKGWWHQLPLGMPQALVGAPLLRLSARAPGRLLNRPSPIHSDYRGLVRGQAHRGSPNPMVPWREPAPSLAIKRNAGMSAMPLPPPVRASLTDWPMSPSLVALCGARTGG